MIKPDPLWWQRGILYQIYPRSFQDGNGDGVGDLAGIDRRLDYIRSLGVDAVWISPIFVSPMIDFGYDVADYRTIDPVFGTNTDFDTLLDHAHSIGLRVILDLVPNHTSDRHSWFQDSRSSRNSEKRSWYVWRDAKPDGSLPNNWVGAHGGKAWSWDAGTGQYYLHSYQPQMPDLNWDNPAVREAIYDVMRFWLNRGVDGFRVDVVLRLAKDQRFRDEPPNPAYRPERDPEYDSLLHIYTRDVDRVHHFIREIRDVIDEYEGRLLIGETNLPVHRLVRYYGSDKTRTGDETHIPFNFGLITQPFQAPALRAYIIEYLSALMVDGKDRAGDTGDTGRSLSSPYRFTPNWVIGSHDRGRIASTERAGEHRSKVAAMLLLTLPGFITIYYGDEIGLDNGEFAPEEMLDNLGKNNAGTALTRDRARTPMQWDTTPYAGFSDSPPWLPVGPDYRQRNVKSQETNPQSLLHLHRRLIAFRHDNPSFADGSIEFLPSPETVLVYRVRGTIDRNDKEKSWTVILNFEAPKEELPGTEAHETIFLATDTNREGTVFDGTIAGYQGVILGRDSSR